jgi:hypothetical protein
MVTFNYANIRKDENGQIFLDLELQIALPDQRFILRNTFPQTVKYDAAEVLKSSKGVDRKD